MCYIRAKTRPVKIRDGGDGEMKVVTNQAWVLFDKLPRGMSPDYSLDVEIRAPITSADCDAIEAENPVSVDAPKKRKRSE
jgi:hypothetical protein